ncbi:hypothetical protein SDC9_55023 [bioreactor metagenome]|uniref:Uncharacterized protein n=1 Tax=bioreactor metagenome TaxID=1076179 RepID=A0A644WY33_9ZZZZ
MGTIDPDLIKYLQRENPKSIDILSCFLNDFDVGFGAKRQLYNTSLYAFLMKPTETFAETFGLSCEVLLIYSNYPEMQARTMQSISAILSSDPAKGRAETLICIIVSDAIGAKEWVSTYTIEQQDLRSYVVFETDDLLLTKKKNVLPEFRKQLNERDLFDIQLPLLDDLYFFGRDEILSSIIDSIKKCENRGIFGLRKTGKTSLLYKVKRVVEQSLKGRVLFYDAKNVKIRNRTGSELLNLITIDIARELNLTNKIDTNLTSSVRIAEQFEEIVRQIPFGDRIVLIFDEIEFISFQAPFNEHWKKDYFDLWQTIWSVQSTYRNLCFIVSGVNASICEISSINHIQNPLFGIIKADYLQGLGREDIYNMSRRIGKRMGLKFEHDAIDYLHKRYGGHPLLTRLALSYENKKACEKPILFTVTMLKSNESIRETELAPFCQHIVDVLDDYYNDEYILLELLACDNIADFMELSDSPIITNHLINYGLLFFYNGIPKIGIPVVGEYIRSKEARKHGRQLAKHIIQPQERRTWAHSNTQTIISYMRQLETLIFKQKLPLLFGSNSFPQAEKLVTLPVAQSEDEFRTFISTFYKCFVESISNYGASIGKGNYFWTEIRGRYPNLFRALLRIKAYRNWSEHLKLNEDMQKVFDDFIYEDLEGKQFHLVKDGFFILQQCTINSLMLAISVEINNLS